MKARVFEAQADFFEVGVLSQTAEVQAVSVDQLLDDPSGPPVVIVGGLLGADRLADMRRLSSVLGRARTAVILVPPFTDLDLGRYFETPVQLRAQRRSAESLARIVDGAAAAALGEEVKVRSDHFFETALGAGVTAVDAQGKPVLIRFQASNTSGPVFFSALQLLTYTALTDEGQRQELLGHLVSWAPTAVNEPAASARGPSAPLKTEAVTEGVLMQVALLLAAGGLQTTDQLRARAHALLGADLSADDVHAALEELGRRGVLEREGPERGSHTALDDFIEQRGMHPYVRELADLLASEETHS